MAYSISSLSGLDLIRLGYQGVESSSVAFQNSSPKRLEKMHKFQTIFLAATGFLAFVDYLQVWDFLERRWSVISFFKGDLVLLPFIGIAGAIFTGSFVTINAVSRHFQPKIDPNTYLPHGARNISVKWERPESQESNNYLLGCRVIINIALACLAANPYVHLACSTLQIYSLSKTVQWNWIRYDRTFDSPQTNRAIEINGIMLPILWPAFHRRLRALTITYFRPMLPALEQKNENCSICLEEKPTTQFCNEHAAHEACIVGSIYGEMERFADPSMNMWDKYVHLDGIPTRYIRDGIATHVEYSFRASNQIFPRCSECRDRSSLGEIQFTTVDQEFASKKIPAKVEFY